MHQCSKNQGWLYELFRDVYQSPDKNNPEAMSGRTFQQFLNDPCGPSFAYIGRSELISQSIGIEVPIYDGIAHKLCLKSSNSVRESDYLKIGI